MGLIEILKESELFKGLKEEELTQVAQLGTLNKYSSGDSIFAEGSTGKEFYIVASGSVAINKNIAGGRKRNLSNLIQGDILGELSLFDSQPRSADAEVIEDAEVVVFSNDEFRQLLKSNLVIAFIIQTRLIRTLCKRLRNTDELLKEGVIWGFKIDT